MSSASGRGTLMRIRTSVVALCATALLALPAITLATTDAVTNTEVITAVGYAVPVEVAPVPLSEGQQSPARQPLQSLPFLGPMQRPNRDRVTARQVPM
jgi:hypothetical protein